MNYYKDIKSKLIDNEITKKVKDYSKNRSDLYTYYEVGKLLSESGKHYGDGIIKEYSKRLILDLGINYTERTLRRFRQFYNLFCNEKWSTLSTKLSWSHYSELLKFDDIRKISYYISISEQLNLSVRELREKIKNNEYERLPTETKEKIEYTDSFKVDDFIKNPIVIRSTNDYDDISEKMLQRLILDNIPMFLKELGSNYSFIDNEYKIKIGDKYNYIDLLLYNIEFNCYVVVELKITELRKEHIGQIQIYMNYIDKVLKRIDQDKTIGIIIVKKNNSFIMEYCSDDRVLAREYKLI